MKICLTQGDSNEGKILVKRNHFMFFGKGNKNGLRSKKFSNSGNEFNNNSAISTKFNLKTVYTSNSTENLEIINEQPEILGNIEESSKRRNSFWN